MSAVDRLRELRAEVLVRVREAKKLADGHNRRIDRLTERAYNELGARRFEQLAHDWEYEMAPNLGELLHAVQELWPADVAPIRRGERTIERLEKELR